MAKEKKRGWWHRPWVFRSLVTAGVLVFLALSITTIVWVPGYFVDSAAGENPTPPLTPAERVTVTTNARQGVLFIVGGVIAIFTLLISLAKHNLDRKGQELGREKQELDRDANRTTRYTEAIKQLGDKTSYAIRLGGIYALERIAQDSERDRQTILEVLWSYLRAESRLKTESGEDVFAMESDAAAAATASSRITQLSLPTNNMILPNVNLIGADLIGASFADANLTGASFVDANLTGANLTGANFTATNLSRANLTDANLTDATLHYVDLTNTNLTSTNLTNADLYNASRRLTDPTNNEEVRILITKKYLQDNDAKGIDTVKSLPANESTDVL